MIVRIIRKAQLYGQGVFGLGMGALVAFLLVWGGQPSECQREWALCFLQPWPQMLRWSLALLALLIGWLPFSPWLHRFEWGKRSSLHFFPAGFVLVLLFWLLRERTPYGDALYKLYLLHTQSLRTDPYVWKEPLDSLLAYQTTAWLRAIGQPPEVAIALLSVAAGAAFLWAIGTISTQVAQGRLERWLLIGALLGLGSTQLWFGHIENYSLVTAAVLCMLAAALRYLQGKAALWGCGLLGGLACSFHPQAIFVVPGLLWLLDRRRWLGQGLVLVGSGLVFPLLTVLSLLGLGVALPSFDQGYAGDTQLFWHLNEILMPARLWDMGMNLLLVAPLLPLWIVLAGWGARHLRHDRRFWLLATAAFGVLIYHFSFRNELPRAQDWDLFAIVGPVVTLAGAYAGVRWLEAGRDRTASNTGQRLALTAVSLALLLTLAWVVSNHFYTRIAPTSAQRELFVRYRLVDLTTELGQATVQPTTPICDQPTGCERVALSEFTMPQNGDRRTVLFAHAPSEISFPIDLPADATFLWFSPALDPQSWGWGGDGVRFQVKIRRGGTEQILWQRLVTPEIMSQQGWLDAFVPLALYAGERVELVLSTDPGPNHNDAGDRSGWGYPWLMRGTYGGGFDPSP
ncbi:MAG: hypothetical protein U0175_13110 [Caldilineaceae bacterium]